MWEQWERGLKILVRSRAGFVKNKEAISLVLQFPDGVGSLIYRRTKKLTIVMWNFQQTDFR